MLITFEGGEGSGKTTVIKEVCKYLIDNGIDYILSREPGGCDIAEQIREVILKKENTAMDGLTEAYLYAASRNQHIKQIVGPSIEGGKIVLLDRYYDSSVVYQGYVRGYGMDKIYELNQEAIRYKDKLMIPDLTIYFDLAPEIGLSRIAKNSEREVNRLDLEKIDFHNKVREGYLEWAKKNPDRIMVIDASGTVEEVTTQVMELLRKRLEK